VVADTPQPEETPPREKIPALQSVDVHGSICWKSRGLVAPDPAGLAKLLGVAETELAWGIDPEAWAEHEKLLLRLKRPRSSIAKETIPW
jgi:hypothetical protein